MPLPEPINRIRRRSAQLADQLAASAHRRLRGGNRPLDWNGDARFALLTVNFHTTRYLKLMLLSLAEQDNLALLDRLIIVDNGSKDSGLPFLKSLAKHSNTIELVENRRWTHHARGMRLAWSALDRGDAERTDDDIANVLLFCDPDVLFLRSDTLSALASCFQDPQTSHAGELRTHLRPLPEAQASFLAVRRDWGARRDISPWVNHGSPAWWLQRDLIKKGGKAINFPSNSEGFILHRGRSAVASTRVYAPGHAYATARRHDPHFMGIRHGPRLWDARAEQFAQWLEPDREDELVDRLAEMF